MSESNLISILKQSDRSVGVVGSPSDSFEAIIDIRDVSAESKLLGDLVCFTVKEGENIVLVLGQITDIRTVNRWHEEPSFKGIIKRHGRLPNLSGIADNRVAKITVQSSFNISGNISKAHKLANSPSTGELVGRVSNAIMENLVVQYKGELICIGNAYDTDVAVPFWLRHFGETKSRGAGDAYHIGVFGRIGSGKTTVAANMLLGYARHSEYMSILILDPQEQFYGDNNVLPSGVKFEKEMKSLMKYEKYRIPEDVALPNNAVLFSRLLLHSGFIRKFFNLKGEEVQDLMAESIKDYISGRMKKGSFSIGNSRELLAEMIKSFNKPDKKGEYRYLNSVYTSPQWLKKLKDRVNRFVDDPDDESMAIFDENKKTWDSVAQLFDKTKQIKLQDIIDRIVVQPGNVITLSISGRSADDDMESVKMLYIKEIEDSIKQKGAEIYTSGGQSNCLVVLDEAHRYMSTYSNDGEASRLSKSIIDAVRTTRKYGIGYMFITQTIESLDEEIRRQIRIFAFGYGLTSGSEFSKIKDTINDDAAAKFYRSFIDPASNNKYPFMFYGPISPLSFTGAPLFLEMGEVISDFPTNRLTKPTGNGD